MIEYFIADLGTAGGVAPLLEAVRVQIARGIAYIQVRHKEASAREQYELALRVVELRRAAKAEHATRILVNSRSDIALAVGADGVHLPATAPHEHLPGLLVFRSCHTVGEVRLAEADAVTFGPVFASPGKGPGVGLSQMAEACGLGKQVFALGGIDHTNAYSCLRAGAFGIAGIRLFLPGPNRAFI